MYGRGATTDIFAVMRVAVVALFACGLVGCDEGEPRVEPRPSPLLEERDEPRDEGYLATDFEDGGSIGGVVRWVGDIPTPASLEVRTDGEVCGATQPAPTLRVSERRAVSGVVVWLTDVREGRAFQPPEDPPVMAFRGCRFTPHVIGVGLGWALRFTNADSVIHNVKAIRDGETVLDVGLPEAGATATHVFDAPGPVRLVCDAGHGWELGWVHVFAHPYYAITADDGRYRIADVPPGQYVLLAWHEGWQVDGTRAGRPRYSNPIILSRAVSVSARQETSVDFQLSEQSAAIAGSAD